MLDSRRAAAIGRIGAHQLHASRDSADITRAARSAFLDKFEHEADPDGVLAPQERRRRAGHLRRAHMLRLALRSADVRRARRDAGKGGAR
jgi:hypothetical protein